MTSSKQKKIITGFIGLMLLSLFLNGCGSSLTNRAEEQQNTEVVADEAFDQENSGVDESVNIESEVTNAEGVDSDIDVNSDIAFEDENSADENSFGDDFASEDVFAEDDFSDEAFNQDEFSEDEFENLEDDLGADSQAINEEGTEEDLFSDTDDLFAEDTGGDSFADSSATAPEQNMENSFEENLDESFSDVSQEPVSDDLINTDSLYNTGNEITSLEYDSELRGGSVIIRAAKNMEFNTRFDSDKSQYIVDIANTSIPEIYKRPMFMKDFDQNLAAVSTYEQKNGSARVIIQVKNGLEPNVSVDGSALTVSPGSAMTSGLALTPNNPGGSSISAPTSRQQSYTSNIQDPSSSTYEASDLETYLSGSGNFNGEKISLQVNDEDVKTVINFIADQSGANIVIGPDVGGNVTLKLRNIPWDQALMTIMKTHGLGYIRTGNVLRIGKLDDLQKESDAALRIRESQKKLEPIIMKVIPLKYASPEEIQKKLEVLLTKDRGSILSDLRTSSVIVNDTVSVINKMSKLIKDLDTAPPQVLIESKIVEASKTFVREIGLRWGLRGKPTNLNIDSGSGQPVTITPSLRLNNIANNTGQIAGGTDPLSAGLSIGSFDFLGNIQAVLNLKEQDDQVRIISSPRVVTLNNQEASIVQATELIRTRTVIIDGQATVEPITVPLELNLKVTPQITTDASIMLDVDVKREFPGVEDEASQQSPKNSRQAKTKVLVDNNKTAVIGGIYQNDSQIGEIGVPILKDIPILGWLFKTKTRTKVDTELMIFITPRILDKNYQNTSDMMTTNI